MEKECTEITQKIIVSTSIDIRNTSKFRHPSIEHGPEQRGTKPEKCSYFNYYQQ